MGGILGQLQGIGSFDMLEAYVELDAGAIERLLDLGDCSRDLRRRELTREPNA